MATPINTKKDKPKKPRKPSVKITPQIGQNILTEWHEKHYPQKKIAATYGLARITVQKYISKTPYDPSTAPVQFNPLDVLKRVDMTSLQRMELLGKDAAQSLELVIAAINHKVRAELEATKDNMIDKAATLSIKDLTVFFEKAAPYVLHKKDSNVNLQKKGKGGEETPKGKAYEMFKKAN